MSGGFLALITARNEADRIAATLEAVRAIPEVEDVVVVDDGSADGTAAEAAAAGARVLIAPRSLGKGNALEAALERLEPADAYLLVDADVGASAKEASALVDEVRSGRADMAIGVLPRNPRHGGFRLVKRLSASLILALAGFRAQEPMSGQRALTRRVLWAVRPLARGFGLETAMTIDAARFGFRIVEVPVVMEHRTTGRDLPGFLHRARQGRDVLAVAWLRALGLR